jgi:hypothetical protein
MIAEPPTQDIQAMLEDVFSNHNRTLLYIFGPPGAGKTTLLAEACAQAKVALMDPPARYWHPLFARGHGRVGVYLGKKREKFGGTDALPMNAITGVLAELGEQLPNLVIGEGDRLANDRFFSTMRDLGYELCLFYLTANPAILEKRYRARGANQDASWRRGRITKASKLARRWHGDLVKLNATMPIAMNAEHVSSAITDRLSRLE